MTTEHLQTLEIKGTFEITSNNLLYKKCRIDGCEGTPVVAVKADNERKNDMIGLCEEHKV